MQPIEFISKWKAVDLSERAAAHSHFIDLCALLGEDNPIAADPTGETYCFERGAVKTTGRPGWADVWKKDCFGWEYKKKRRNLTEAFVQLQQYAIALENPPLLVVSDIDRIEIHTNWTNSVSTTYEYTLDDIRDARVRDLLKCVWADPEKLRPGKTRAELTEEAAAEFAALAQRLRQRGHNPETVAHFINRLVFCMFAEDAALLPDRMFKRMLEQARRHPSEFAILGADLFRAMKDPGGRVGFEHVDWFNGGLFDDDTAIPLDGDDIALMQRAANLNWSEIDTSIFGTLFERGLDPDKRSQLGAHYTDRDKIRLIVEPVISRPWLMEWTQIKATLAALTDSSATRRRGRSSQPSLAVAAYHAFIERLRAFRVLDPACGSGNFLYVALLALKDIEHQVTIEAEALGLEREFPHIGPESVLGIEINPYAAELARITVWIGEIQWMRRNGFNVSRDPILKPLNTIECRDAILDPNGAEPDWPAADVVIGNPPFLGDKAMRARLGREYTTALRAAYAGRVSGNSDLICYWFEKARAEIAGERTIRAGLVATNAIRRGANRGVLDRTAETAIIFDVWPDEEWTIEGAAVRVALICFSNRSETLPKHLSAISVPHINPDLTSARDLTRAQPLVENIGVALQGPTKGGAFDVPGATAREWLRAPLNPNGRPNSDVVKPWFNGEAITERWSDRWIIDFGLMAEAEASLYEAPFEHVVRHVRPARLTVDRERRKQFWWQFNEPAPGVRAAILGFARFIVTPETPTHTVFAWLPRGVAPDKNLIVIARDDDTTFGVLQSRFHLAWVRRLGSPYGNHPTARRYNSSRVFRTFPFPEGLTPNRGADFYSSDPRSADIASAARRLDELRRNWLNPPNLIRVIPEIVPGFPDRILPVDDTAAATLRARTLTNLYNERPQWLANAHRDLDAAVARAYGWAADISEEGAVAQLLDLNQLRVAAEEQRPQRARRVRPEQLRREPELPPMPIPGGRPEQEQTAVPVAQPARRRRSRRREAS